MELKVKHINTSAHLENVKQDALLASLREITHAADKHSRSVVKTIGLSTAHIVVLRAVQTLGEGTTRQLSRNVSLSQATVTVLLNKLEKLNLVVRTRSLSDRRIVHSKLTPAGEKLIISSPSPLPLHFIKAFAALTETRQKEILDALFDVAQMMSESDYKAAASSATDRNAF